jgi:hypothetical protein
MVFSGNIRNRWIDRDVDCILPKRRIAKEVRANLFLKWLNNAFPQVPMLFMMRHPCAVVLSRIQMSWLPHDDIAPLLDQPDLVRDFLSDQGAIIKEAESIEPQHAILWSVNNLVPLVQFSPGELNVVFYENLVARPDLELPRIMGAVGVADDPSVLQQVNRPSRTASGRSAIMRDQDRLGSWKRIFSSGQIDAILRVVEKFGLGHLYDDSLMPRVADAWYVGASAR